jgi:hypothetical protein
MLAMPDIGTLVSVARSRTHSAAAGHLMVAAAPLLTLRRLRRTEISVTARVVE